MTAAIATVEKEGKLLARYPITEQAISDLRAEYGALTADTPEGYDLVRAAIGKCKAARGAVEKTRKDLKEEALRYGQAVDGAARSLRVPLEEIEADLQAKKDAVDAERARLKREKEEADLIAREAELKAAREAEEARIKAEQAAEDARLAAERDRQEKDRQAFAARQAEADKKRADEEAALAAQRAEIEAAQRKLDEDKAAAARAEEERQAAIKAEADAKEAAERAAAEAARLEALRPDIEKVRAWGSMLRTLVNESAPAVDSAEAKAAIRWSLEKVDFAAGALERFTPRAR